MCSIKRFLQQNQFPIYRINRIIKNFLDRQYSTINKLQNVPKLPVLILLPYLGVYSVRLKKNINQFLGKIYPHIEFKFVFQPAKRIGSFFPFKDRAPSHLRSSVVYKFSCSSCKVLAKRCQLLSQQMPTLLGIVGHCWTWGGQTNPTLVPNIYLLITPTPALIWGPAY